MTPFANMDVSLIHVPVDNYSRRNFEVAAEKMGMELEEYVNVCAIRVTEAILAQFFGNRPVGGYAFELPRPHPKTASGAVSESLPSQGLALKMAVAMDPEVEKDFQKAKKRRRRKSRRKDRR